jgi:hypothetical protein
MKSLEMRFSRELFNSLMVENFTDLEESLTKIAIKEMIANEWPEVEEIEVTIF